MPDRSVTLNPFMTFVIAHDYEQMHWVTEGRETRRSFGPGLSMGTTARHGPVFLRSQLTMVQTKDHALSGHNNHWHLFLHLGWAF